MEELKTSDEYAAKRAEFEKSKIGKLAEKEFKVKPYSEKYKNRYYVTIITSYVFNVLSMITFFVLPYFFFLGITGDKIISSFITTVILFLLEYYKRDLSKDFFKEWKQFSVINKTCLSMVLLLTSLSVGGTYFGAKELVNQSSSEYVVINPDSLSNVIAIKEQIKAIRSDKEGLES